MITKDSVTIFKQILLTNTKRSRWRTELRIDVLILGVGWQVKENIHVEDGVQLKS